MEKDREGYLRRLLSDIVENRKRLPILVVDNTDEFSSQYKQVTFRHCVDTRHIVSSVPFDRSICMVILED